MLVAQGEPSSPLDQYSEILKCDLVVRGEIISASVKQERINDGMPFWPTADPEATTPMARVRLAVDEVLRGALPTNPVEFIAYVSLSHMQDNYETGQETVVGLMWGPDVMDGMFTMMADRRRFVRTSEGWEQQGRSSLVLNDLSYLRSILEKLEPHRLLADADAIITARLTEKCVEFPVSPQGARYGLMTYRLSEVEVLRGEFVNDVKAITSGDYWPVWREDPTYPQNVEVGRRYCFFLRRTEDGFAVLRGISGVYEIWGDDLAWPGRRAIDLTLDEVRAQAGRN